VAVEVDHAVEGELALTLSDFMWRRTFLAFTPDRGESALPVVVERMAQKLGWDRGERQRQLERYHAQVEGAVAPLRAAKALAAARGPGRGQAGS
jgi:glycerol-3-phosphate dehydrogenase